MILGKFSHLRAGFWSLSDGIYCSLILVNKAKYTLIRGGCSYLRGVFFNGIIHVTLAAFHRLFGHLLGIGTLHLYV